MHFINQLGMNKAREMFFLAQPITAQDALNVGLINRVATVLSSESFERINAYRTKVYKGSDYLEGIHSFLEKRAPEYKGKAKDLDTMVH